MATTQLFAGLLTKVSLDKNVHVADMPTPHKTQTTQTTALEWFR